MGRNYAGILGLTAFATVIVRGLLESGGSGVMLEAPLAMGIFAAAGWVIGTIAESTVKDAVEAAFHAEVAAQEAQEKKAA